MDPRAEARLQFTNARISRDKKAIRRAEKAIDRIESPGLIRQWTNYWYDKLRPPQKTAEQRYADEIVKALRDRR